MQYLLFAAIVLVLAWFVTAPLRRPSNLGEIEAQRAEASVAEVQLRKEAKYREIRDAQLDHAAGKLSDDDFAELDAELRRDAVTILAELDRAEAERQRAGS